MAETMTEKVDMKELVVYAKGALEILSRRMRESGADVAGLSREMNQLIRLLVELKVSHGA